jgi:hypothetical protein
MNAQNTRNTPNSWWEKLQKVKELVLDKFSKADVPNLQEVMSRIAHFHYNKKKYFLVGTERKLYDFLIENSYNPYTVYRWLLLENVPEDMRFRLRNNQLSQRKAFALKFERRQPSEELASSMKLLGMKLIRSM